ncbi:WYL domain-containing protein [Vibrio splendidus]|uniref:WYL domain-containing protein n=1 Tax=Vibrio splendidus TaxID=29497 RepID=UPI000769BF58|nr:WYL domain-containing protein [Vibrio splendidus]
MSIQSLLELEGGDKNSAVRLAYIDFKLRFSGFINRSDLTNMFGLKEAASSKLMSLYAEKTEKKNMVYDHKIRANVMLNTFEPLLNINSETALGMLANGFNKNKIYETPELPYTRIGQIPNQLQTENVERITRAMAGGYSITCDYMSASSENHSSRELVPLTLLFDGINWIFRAYYRNENKFRNFNFSRALNVKENSNSPKAPHEELTEDKEWTTQVPLLLIPHPFLEDKDKETLAADFGLKDSKLIITERLALIWLLKSQWKIDDRCSDDLKNERRFKTNKFNFLLSNQDMVKAVRETIGL